MILSLFRRTASDAIVERLYVQIVAAARRPPFYQPPIGVADTFEGRFEVLVLHAFLVLRRLSALPPPAPDLGQDIANRMFQGFDAALREMGVGDLTVPKRMKRLAESFGGRSAAYARALGGEEDLGRVIARNVYGSSNGADGGSLAAWACAVEESLAGATLVDFERGLPSLPLPVGQGALA